MSPLFGKHHDADAGLDGASPEADSKDLPRLVELGPALDDAVKDAATTALPKLAAKLMNELFGSSYQPRGNGVDVDAIAGPLIPPNSGSKFGDPTPPGVDILWDIAAEAMQLLQRAGLIVPDLWYSGQVACFGYHSTRAGRTAVEQDTVEQLLTAALDR
jgi:hypothetical protein